MKIALLGSTGMLGSKVLENCRARGHEVAAPSRAEADLASPVDLERFFQKNEFEALVNCAGFTGVDLCEEPSHAGEALAVNATAVGWLAKFCKASGRRLVHFSTDYVFDGKKAGAYSETDEPHPLNAYGRTKRMGEGMLLGEDPPFYLIRTSWVYGPNGKNFVSTIMELLKRRDRIEVVDDQVGAPTYTGDLAVFTLELLERNAQKGIYHFSNAGETSWHGIAVEVQRSLGLTACRVLPISSDKYQRAAKRPLNSRFDLRKALGFLRAPIRPWQEALRDHLKRDFV